MKQTLTDMAGARKREPQTDFSSNPGYELIAIRASAGIDTELGKELKGLIDEAPVKLEDSDASGAF